MGREVGGHCHTHVGIAAGTVISIRALCKKGDHINTDSFKRVMLFLSTISVSKAFYTTI